MYRPGQLPRPYYGFNTTVPDGQAPITRPRLPEREPMRPEEVMPMLQARMPPPRIPDTVLAKFGMGKPEIVGQVLAAAEGKPSRLNLDQQYAQHILRSYNYPTTMDAWSPAEWEAAIGAHADEPSPLDLLYTAGG